MKSSSPIVSDSGMVQAIATLGSIIATLAVNSLSNFYPPGGLNVGQISNTVFQSVQITPASYAFAIWGVIYVGLIAYGIHQLQPPQRRDRTIRRANRFLIAACLVQVLWIFMFTLRWFWLSVVAMGVILAMLILAYRCLGIGHQPTSRRRRWLVHVPFSLYLAWISVATIVNVACALFHSGLQTGGTGWTLLMLIVGAGLGTAVARLRADITFVMVFVWAYGAIALKQQDSTVIVATALIGIAIMLGQLLLTRRWQTR